MLFSDLKEQCNLNNSSLLFYQQFHSIINAKMQKGVPMATEKVIDNKLRVVAARNGQVTRARVTQQYNYVGRMIWVALLPLPNGKEYGMPQQYRNVSDTG